MIKNYIIVGLISVLIVFGVVLSVKCKRLEQENLQLKVNTTNIIDSIKTEKKILEEEIQILSDEIIVYEHKLDSLKHVKQQVVVKYKTQHVVSKDLSDGVKKLKENLRCEK